MVTIGTTPPTASRVLPSRGVSSSLGAYLGSKWNPLYIIQVYYTGILYRYIIQVCKCLCIQQYGYNIYIYAYYRTVLYIYIYILRVLVLVAYRYCAYGRAGYWLRIAVFPLERGGPTSVPHKPPRTTDHGGLRWCYRY